MSCDCELEVYFVIQQIMSCDCELEVYFVIQQIMSCDCEQMLVAIVIVQIGGSILENHVCLIVLTTLLL